MKTYLARIALCAAIIGLALPNSTTLVQAFAADTLLTITSPEMLPSGITGKSYSYQFKASGGTAPYTWDVLTQQLNVYPCCLIGLYPNGKFSSVGTGDSQMPHSGTYQIGVKVTDKNGQSVEKISQFTINTAGTEPTKYKAGVIDKISATEISGWGYDNDRAVDVIAVIENISDKKVDDYKFRTEPTTMLPDVASYLSTKFSIGGILVPLGFSFNPSETIKTAGTYRIKSITYNKNKFIFKANSSTTFTIGSTEPNDQTTTPTTTLGKHRLVQVNGKGTIYYINPRGQIMPLRSTKVFESYGNKKENIESITRDEFKQYKKVEYIKLKGSDTIYELDGKKIREVSTEAKAKLEVVPADVVEVNDTEYKSYKQGKIIK